MNKIAVYGVKLNKKSDISVPVLFKEKKNPHLLSQALRVYGEGLHFHLAKTKTRGEVKTSTRKIYRQKGTGLARHGAKSAPIFVGGGVAHGPSGLKRTLKISDKMRQRALRIALSLKLEEGDVIALDSPSLFKKTKDVAAFLKGIGKKLNRKNENVTFVVRGDYQNLKALKNIKNSKVIDYKDLNAYDVYHGGLLIFDSEVFKARKEQREKKVNVGKKTETKTKTRMKGTK